MKMLLVLMSLLLSHFSFCAQLTIVDKSDVVHTYDSQQLLNMAQHTITTDLPWLNSASTFSGVTFEDLFNDAGLDIPYTVTLTALNNYQIVLDKKDIEQFSPIIAILKDGNPMSVREKGPYWVIFSLELYPELDNTDYHAKMIWQLKEIRL
ncbi:hypothetical protein ACE1OE_12590 [Vibrio sp. E150_011]|uniref:hypothetical protein n=1 Tax=Vibrio sp. 10N.261.51.F12 TaxID=3229679 RepID=UPI00354F80C8